MKKKSVLLWDSFAADEVAHGGSNRSKQIRELCTRAGFEITKFQKNNWTVRNLFLAVRGLPRTLTQMPATARNLTGLCKAVRLVAVCGGVGPHVVVCEKCYWTPWVLALRRLAPMVCLPHNIEAIVPGQENALRVSDAEDLAAELSLYRQMHAVFCICPEDAAIVQAVGVPTFVLPYYPVSEVEQGLLAIREQRLASNESDGSILILGTAANGPTMRGMVELLGALRSLPRWDSSRFIVAGHGTEQLREPFGDSCQILGSVSNEKLKELLIDAKCLMVHHAPTSGCLTRIVDALCAGLPVICNSYAARGYPGVSGLNVYDQLSSGLAKAINASYQACAIPRRPVEAEDHFKSFLVKMAGLS